MSDETTASEDTPSVTFFVKSAGNAKYTITLPLSTTTLDLKKKLSTSEYANVPATSQRLIYSGRVLKDEDALAVYNVKEGNTMHLVKSAASNQRQNPANQTPTQESTGSLPAQGATGVPQNLAAGTGNNPLAGLTGARYAGHVQLPNASMFGADGGMGAPQAPEDMIQQLQDPHFAQMMNEALSNPQFIDMMIQSNPQLRAMGPGARQMMQSDHFRRMLTDPAALRQMFEFQRMMGIGPMGGAQETFAMPGETTTTDPTNRGTDNAQAQPGSPSPQANPFASMMAGMGGGPGAGANPFAAMMNPAFMGQATQRPQTDAVQIPPAPNTSNTTTQPQQTGQTPQAANPFAALFNPAMFGAPPQTANTDPNAAANPFNNPMMQSMMQNPEMMRNVMQMMGGGGAAPGAAAPTDPNAMMNMMNMLGGMGGGGGGGFGAQEPPDNRPPEERYATQLRQLNEMGMVDFDRNIQALRRSGGDVNGALEWLFGQPQ
jgi:ubiquilin